MRLLDLLESRGMIAKRVFTFTAVLETIWSMHWVGAWRKMCRSPHVSSLGDIQALMLGCDTLQLEARCETSL
jgi:hypothetical protein